MAEINKLSVGKVLDKLRRNDAPKKSKLMQLDEKAEKMDEEIQRLRAATRRLKTNPILADPEGHIIAGHGRLQAARLMGLAELPARTGLKPHLEGPAS